MRLCNFRRGLIACAVLVAALFFESASASAVVLLSWDFGAGGAPQESPDFTHVGISNGLISRGPGLGVSSLAGGFSSNGWQTSASISDAILNNDYLQVQFSTDMLSSLSSIDAIFRRTNTGPRQFQWAYSLDNFSSSTLIGGVIPYDPIPNPGNGMLVSQSLFGVTPLQNISAGSEVWFRLYGANSGGGNFGFGPGGSGSNDLVVNGDVVVTPEPSTLTIFSVLGATTFVGGAWRRRRAKRAALQLA